MRRLFLAAAAIAAVALAVYRNRTIDRYEHELAIGRHAVGRPAAEQRPDRQIPNRGVG